MLCVAAATWLRVCTHAIGSANADAAGCRNFIGFGKELFTDAGQYCIHFGYSAQQSAQLQQKTLEVRSGKQDVHVPEVAAGSSSSKELAVIPTYTGNQLVGLATWGRVASAATAPKQCHGSSAYAPA
jgi:hypothetical protein